jgi:hypothetical protein
MMRTLNITFPQQQALCVFPETPSDLVQAVSSLQLKDDGYPVIVLIGGEIEKQQAAVTLKAIHTIAAIAEDLNALVICGGTNVGIMAEIGKMRWRNAYQFPLIGIAPEALTAWPGGPRNEKFLWWGKQRWQLEPHYTHFILVPGGQFGDESPWIVDAATILSRGHKSVTILINGGEISKKDIELSLAHGRPVIALRRTGRLADELSRQPDRDKLINVVPADADQQIVEAVRATLSATASAV